MQATKTEPKTKASSNGRKGFGPHGMTKREVARDMNEIGRLLSIGLHTDRIQEELGINRKQLEYRLRQARGMSLDTGWIWTRHYLAMHALLQQLAVDREAARKKGHNHASAKITDLMAKNLRSIIEVGQSLGVIQEAPKNVNLSVTDATLGLFHEVDYSEVEPARIGGAEITDGKPAEDAEDEAA